MEKQKEPIRIVITLAEREDGDWQADYGDCHGIGLTKEEALVRLAHAMERAEWKARPEPKVCLTCGIFGGHEPGCVDDPTPKRNKKRA